MGIRIGNRKIKFRFFIIIAILLAITIYLLTSFPQESHWDTIKEGEITLWNEANGLIIRQEKVYKAQDYGKVKYFLPEGCLVDQDTLVGLLYRSEYDEDLMEELYRIKSKISDYRSNSLTHKIEQNDYINLQKNIENLATSIQFEKINGIIGNMERHEKELKNLLLRREEVLKSMEIEDTGLELLYRQENELEEELREWKEKILAPEHGILGFKLDDLEEILSPSVLDYLNLEQLQSFLDFQPELPKDEDGLESPLFKVVKPEKWHIAAIIPHKDIFYDGDDNVMVRLSGLGGLELPATIYKVDSLKEFTLIVLEFVSGLEHVIDIRNIVIEIGSQSSGLMVPKEALIKKDNKFIVKTGHHNNIQNVEVRVLAADDDWAIIGKVNPRDSLELNDSVLIN